MESIENLKTQLAEAKAEIVRLSGKTGSCSECERREREIEKSMCRECDGSMGNHALSCPNSVLVLKANLEKLEAVIDHYAAHEDDCILSQWSQGEPTPDGGYRTMYAGKWYRSNPIDETPKCNCGLEEALAAAHPPTNKCQSDGGLVDGTKAV